jgi:IS4 transposase
MLVEFHPSKELRRKRPEVPDTMPAQLVAFQVKGYRPTTVITSLLDPEEIGTLYHLRWEIEISYDEIKTHMLEREEALRSKRPEGARQEIFGIGIAYNLIRVEMARVAEEQGLPPNRISFTHALRFTGISA